MKKGLKIFLGVIFFMAIMLVYYTYYSYSIKPPSEKWSKEVKISSGVVKSNVKVLNYKGNYIVAHDDGTAIKIIETDITGKILKENKIETGRFINYITLFTVGDNLFVSYVEPNSKSGTLYTITLNKYLKEVECKETKDVLKVQQIDDEMLLLIHSSKIEIINLKTGVKIVENISTKVVSGSKNLDGSYIICYEENSKYLGIKIKNDKIVERYNFAQFITISGMTVDSISSSSDETHIYILLEVLYKGEYGEIQMMSYEKNSKNCTTKRLAIDNENYLYDSVAVKNSDGTAEFLIDAYNNFLDVKFRNNEIVEVNKATRMSNNALNIGVNENAIAFINGGKVNDVYLASKDEKFKQVNNVNRKDETKEAISIANSHIISQLTMIFFYGLLPLSISILPMLVTTFFLYDSRHKKKRRVVLLFSYIILIILKSWKVYEKCFQVYLGRLPELINNPAIIMVIMLIISAICMYLAYERFEKNEYGIDLWAFLKYALIDTFISAMFYLPYIV